MFVSPIQTGMSKKVVNKPVSFQGKADVCLRVRELSNCSFSPTDSVQNAKTLKEITRKLLKAVNDVPCYDIRSMSTNCQGTIKPFIKRLHNLRNTFNVNPDQYYRFLSDSPEKYYLSLHNLGNYENTNVEQIVLQFKDPNTGEFIGLSNDENDNLAITTNNRRHEFYYRQEDNCPYRGKAEGSYIPTRYIDYYDESGNSVKKNLTFWDWLFG